MSFHVGQKVVCVDDKDQINDSVVGPCDFIRKGDLYVIRELLPPDWYGQIGVSLVGMNSGVFEENGEEAGWKIERFLPLEELQQESKERYYAEHPVHA